jgi:hypothetical protein
MFCELAYLGQVILAAASYATLRDLADYGVTLAFDEAERIMDRKYGDPEKQGLLLDGKARLNGRNLEPWRAILAVAARLDAQNTSGELQHVERDEENGETAERQGLFDRLERLPMAYQYERSDLEAQNPVRLLSKALGQMFAHCQNTVLEFDTSGLAQEMNRVALEDEILSDNEEVTNPKRLDWLIKRLRFERAPRTEKRKRWKISQEQ